MLLILALIIGIDIAGFLWFRSLCLTAVRSHATASLHSNLIPIERGYAGKHGES